jgi:3-phenylpropionate/cinnamic acid dioxygenase small subunit
LEPGDVRDRQLIGANMSNMSNMVCEDMSSRIRDRLRAEQFLFHEAELLDNFRLLDWLALLDRDIDYRIPIRSTRPQDELDRSFSATTFHMIEHFGSLEARMKRFGAGGWSEFPPSRTRRHVSNVRVDRHAPDRLSVKSNLLYFWSRDAEQVIVSAERHDELVERDDAVKLAGRVVYLDHTTLPLPNLSIVL